jgi:hypothetical protein
MSISRHLRLLFFCFSTLSALHAQATGRMLKPLLEQHLQDSAVVAEQLRQFLLQRVPPLATPTTSQEWTTEANQIREHALSIVYHGWPQQWIDSTPKFEKVGVIERPGYRIIKLRFEVVPGFSSTALLYEPDHLPGKAPAILDVSGHGDGGKAAEHKQKRCINQARRGMIALSLEWIDYGELNSEENAHSLLNLLDLAGANGVGLFYLEMKRGIDYLYEDPEVDHARIGVTGLSGGGWQTILLSSLDTRVGPAVPVAGFSSLTTAVEHPEYAGDAEQNPSDFRRAADYAQLAAIRSPRPTLLIYNDMDNCCFRAGVVKQGVYSDIKPFFNLYGSTGSLKWYENQDPGTHNYEIDNRQQSYEFFDSVFHIDVSAKEDIDTDAEVRSYDDLVVGLPKNNQTILGLARSFAKSIHHDAPTQADSTWQHSQRDRLREVVRYIPVTVSHAWVINATHEQGVESHSYCFQFSNGLSATGILFRSLSAAEHPATTVLLSDGGMPTTIDDVGNHVDRGQQVLVLSPLFFGESMPDHSASQYAALLNTLGERPLGIEAAQVTAVVRWLDEGLNEGSSSPGSTALIRASSTPPINIVTTGPRSETIATVAAALEPQLFSTLEARQSISSLNDVFDHPSTYRTAPEMTCLDLFKDFDFNILQMIASPVQEDLSATAPKRMFW